MKRLLGAVVLLACAHAPVEPRSPVLGCEFPPKVVEDRLRIFCMEMPDQSALGCAYVGWEGDEMCLTIMQSKACGKFEPVARLCGIQLKVIPPQPDAEQSSAPQEDPPSVDNNYHESL